MILLEKTDVYGFANAFRGMRNPMESWEKGDSYPAFLSLMAKGTKTGEEREVKFQLKQDVVGPQDVALGKKLVLAGKDHSKFARFIDVYVDITAPLYWWKEFATYRVGVSMNSTSTMHKIMSKPFDISMFSAEEMRGYHHSIKQLPNEIDEDTEEWKTHPHYSSYKISNQGRVKRIISDTKERILNGSIHSDGYVFVTLVDEKYTQVPKHRLVAETWLPESDKETVNHKDGNKLNNYYLNLEWVTQKENIQHSWNNKLQGRPVVTYKGKLTKEQREEIILKYNTTEISKRKLAKEYGVSHTTINAIFKNKYNYGDGVKNEYQELLDLIDRLNELRDEWLITKDKEVWYSLIQLLPGSWNQKRTVKMNYQVLRNMYFARKNHKLIEWREFCQWVESLPYAKELICATAQGEENE